MKRLLLLLLALVAAAGARAAVHTDDSGRRITLAAPAQRIVTLAPNLTEFVYALGAGARLVGTVDTSDHPAEARRVPRVGDFQRVDIERLVALKPDLVLVWPTGNTGRELAQLEAAGLTLFHLEPRRLDEVPRAFERIGELLGLEAAGARRAQALRGELDALRRAHAQQAPVSVFYQVWARPLLTLNDEHLISDVIRLCGGRNVFGALKPLVPEVSTEAVVAADPQAILASRESGPEASSAARREPQAAAFAAWTPLRSLRAVRTRSLYTVPGDLISRQGPRIAEGARALCGALDEVRREQLHPPAR